MMQAPRKTLSMLLLLLFFSGCSIGVRDSPAPVFSCNNDAQKSEIEPDKGSEADAKLRAELVQQSRETKDLQLQLLVKQAEINKLQFSHDRARQEAMRAKARLRSLDGKADTISDIAEAALMIKNAREVSGDKQQSVLIHAEKLLDESRQELQAGNLDDAAYLAAKALDLALPGTPIAEPDLSVQSMQEETAFAAPLVMRVNRQSNIREKPTAASKALFQLVKGSLVEALGYRNLWIRVNAQGNGGGWIYYRLLDTVQLTAQ